MGWSRQSLTFPHAMEIAMNRRMLYQGISAISLAVFALAAGAQTGSSGPAMTTPPAASAVTSTPPSSNAASQAATEKAARVAKHDAKRHWMAQRHHTWHTRMATTSPVGNEETAYRIALKRCVQGPPGARNSCIDDAITKHQRS